MNLPDRYLDAECTAEITRLTVDLRVTEEDDEAAARRDFAASSILHGACRQVGIDVRQSWTSDDRRALELDITTAALVRLIRVLARKVAVGLEERQEIGEVQAKAAKIKDSLIQTLEAKLVRERRARCTAEATLRKLARER